VKSKGRAQLSPLDELTDVLPGIAAYCSVLLLRNHDGGGRPTAMCGYFIVGPDTKGDVTQREPALEEVVVAARKAFTYGNRFAARHGR
jgi:hypothetical protein